MTGRCGNDPRAELTAGDRQAVEEFRAHLAARRAEVLAKHLPPWEAAYDSATFTPRLIAYTNDRTVAQAAAEGWYRTQVENPAGLEWMPDAQMCGDEWAEWHALVYRDASGLWVDTDIVVRCVAARLAGSTKTGVDPAGSAR